MQRKVKNPYKFLDIFKRFIIIRMYLNDGFLNLIPNVYIFMHIFCRSSYNHLFSIIYSIYILSSSKSETVNC